jgi:isoquinoline 1-oxidoreductase beta subunit
MKAGLDKDGKIIAWRHRIVGQSIMNVPAGKIDSSSVEGASTLPYGIPNLTVELHTTSLPVPIQWWRSVGSTHTAYATEAFLDDIAREVKADPYQLRRELLAKHKDAERFLGVLDLVAKESGWDKPRKNGELLGIALHESFNTVVGEVAHVTKTANGFRLDRVTCAVDCGVAVNPNIVAMQMESGIGYGLGAALSGAITLKDGQVEQSNFDGYTVLRMNQMPAIDVHIVPSSNKPTGVGEPGTPPIAPALANAIAQATGKPIRTLPFESQGVKLSPVHG